MLKEELLWAVNTRPLIVMSVCVDRLLPNGRLGLVLL